MLDKVINNKLMYISLIHKSIIRRMVTLWKMECSAGRYLTYLFSSEVSMEAISLCGSNIVISNQSGCNVSAQKIFSTSVNFMNIGKRKNVYPNAETMTKNSEIAKRIVNFISRLDTISQATWAEIGRKPKKKKEKSRQQNHTYTS